jgi:uncharacterized protein (DUF58 family)
MAEPSLRERLDLRRFFRGDKALDGPIVLNHHKVFIVPNRRGLGLFVLLLVQLVASINYNNNLGFILTFLVGSIALLGTVYGFRNLAGLSLKTGRGEPVFVGELAQFKIGLDNPTRTPRIAVQIGLRHEPAQTVNLAGGESLQIKLPTPAHQRGWMALPTVTLASEFPLGIFRAWAPVNLNQQVLVYPRPAPDPLPFPAAAGGIGGLNRSTTDDFHGFQSYQPGDPLRRIHWKGVAKGQGVHVKEYRGEESVQVYLDWLQTPGHNLEAKLSRLCRWVLDAEKTGASYGLRLPGTDLKPASGPAHLRLCLERLALFGY